MTRRKIGGCSNYWALLIVVNGGDFVYINNVYLFLKKDKKIAEEYDMRCHCSGLSNPQLHFCIIILSLL